MSDPPEKDQSKAKTESQSSLLTVQLKLSLQVLYYFQKTADTNVMESRFVFKERLQSVLKVRLHEANQMKTYASGG